MPNEDLPQLKPVKTTKRQLENLFFEVKITPGILYDEFLESFNKGDVIRFVVNRDLAIFLITGLHSAARDVAGVQYPSDYFITDGVFWLEPESKIVNFPPVGHLYSEYVQEKIFPAVKNEIRSFLRSQGLEIK